MAGLFYLDIQNNVNFVNLLIDEKNNNFIFDKI